MTEQERKQALLVETAERLKSSGLRCFVLKEKNRRSYMFVGDDTGVAYMQIEDYGGFNLSSVHKPCRRCGTGFRLTAHTVSKPSAEYVRQIMAVFAPNWSSSNDRKEVQKYSSIEEWLASQRILGYVEL